MDVRDHLDLRRSARDRALGFSPFLGDAIGRFEALADCFVAKGSVAALETALMVDEDDLARRLRVQRHRLALAVALGDLSGELPLEAVTAALSDFADRALDECLAEAMRERVPDCEPMGLAILALGKLGSRELNYSSDVDLILLFDPETMPRRPRDDVGEAAVRYGRRLVELMQKRDAAGYVQRVDLRLRPASEVTPIVLPVSAAISYYESEALPWERAAFIRARACAGDIALGQRFLDEIQPFIWRRALDFGAIDEIRAISLRIRDHYAQGQAFGPGYDLKRGRGGIREAEFFTQVQQLVHGGRDDTLRPSATLDALAALVEADRLDAETARVIGDGYRMLRTVEHRVQMIDDRQEHRLPADEEALLRVARLDGLGCAADLLLELAPHVQKVGAVFDTLVTDDDDRLSNDPDKLAEELSAMGFPDVEEARRRVLGWRSGRARSLRSNAARKAFEAMLPTLLPAIAAGPDPGGALNRFTDVVEKLSSGINLYRLVGARPQLATHLAIILAQAPALAAQLARRPALLDVLIDDSAFAAPPEVAELSRRFLPRIEGKPLDEALDAVRLYVGERRFALGVQLVTGHRDPIVIAEGYSDLAEAAILVLGQAVEDDFAASHGRIEGGALVCLALGRLGGRALTHASDLDLIFLFDAPDGALSDGPRPLGATDYYNRLASRIVSALGVQTAAGPLYEVDTRLRPQGAQGMLAVSLAAFERYQREEAWTWEHMALCRARPLTGTDEAKSRVEALIRNLLTAPRDADVIRRDAGDMRADIARHKPDSGPLDVKLGDGGLVDLEFAVHTLQLTTGIGLDPHLEVAIQALGEAGLIDLGADADLRLLSRLLVVQRLVGQSGVEPPPQSRALVASLCGAKDWDELLDRVSEARSRIASRWAQVRQGE